MRGLTGSFLAFATGQSHFIYYYFTMYYVVTHAQIEELPCRFCALQQELSNNITRASARHGDGTERQVKELLS